MVLNGCNELRHLRCRFPKMRVDDVLYFKQFDLDAALPAYVSFLAASDDPTVILDAPVKQSMECHASLVLPHTEHKASPALPPDAMENEPALSRRAWHVGPVGGPRDVRVDARRHVLRSVCWTRGLDLECEVR